ncbi:hypothetical protein LXA43DRAFT_1103666 [Ganoderma leucocontextum]|nr:hypothetical protein LXA43DRAFT_1103666 [Ganoderma leucocontextum]
MTRRLQPALPYWMKPSASEPPPPPTDLPHLLPFLSFELLRPRPGEDLPDPIPPQVYIGSGHYPMREPDDPPVTIYEFRLIGTGGPRREPTDTTLTFPGSAAMVLHDNHRWERWIEAFDTADATLLPSLLPEQRRSLLDLALFLRALCRQGPDGVDLGEWPFFWAVLMEGFPPPEHLRRGEVHLHRVCQWLRERYPHVYRGV